MKTAAFLAFGVAGVAGLVLAATTAWWLLAVGVACVVAAWFYTGGSRPYGYMALGEVMVFVFFGLVAVIGTTYVQTESWEPGAVYAGIGVGALACAILVVNNLRDIPTDRVAGKRTLAVLLGDERTRYLYLFLVAAAAIAVVGVASVTTWWALVGLVFVARCVAPVRTVLGGANGPALVPVLAATGAAELIWSVRRRRTPAARLSALRRAAYARGMGFLIFLIVVGALVGGVRLPGAAAGQDPRPGRGPDPAAARAQEALTRAADPVHGPGRSEAPIGHKLQVNARKSLRLGTKPQCLARRSAESQPLRRSARASRPCPRTSRACAGTARCRCPARPATRRRSRCAA